MKNTLKSWSVAALLAVGAVHAWAERVEVRATGLYQYDDKQASAKSFATSKPTEDEKSKAVAAARVTAWKLYIAGLPPARQKIMSAHEKELLERLDSFITDTVVIDVYKDIEAHQLKVSARFGVNDEAITQILQSFSSPSADGGLPNGNGAPGNQITFLFIARKTSAVTQFEAKRTDISENEAAKVDAADGGVTATNRVTTGGSTVHKEDQVSYELSSSQDLDTSIGNALSTSGIDFVGYDDVVANCNGLEPEKFRDEFVTADEMSPGTRKQVITAIKSCDIKYFTFGTLDIGPASLDPVTGLKRVTVSVRAQTWDVSPKLPRKVGSVGPEQFAGLGPDPSTASRNAINAAARDVAKNLVDQLSARGIR